MKIRLVVAPVGLAIGFVLPTFAQQKDTLDPQITQQIRALTMKYEEVFNKNDSAALASLFMDDAALVTPQGTIYGREAIEKYSADNRVRLSLARVRLGCVHVRRYTIGHELAIGPMFGPLRDGILENLADHTAWRLAKSESKSSRTSLSASTKSVGSLPIPLGWAKGRSSKNERAPS